jgi:RimJ/RimL family protein N-acetyltransferase
MIEVKTDSPGLSLTLSEGFLETERMVEQRVDPQIVDGVPLELAMNRLPEGLSIKSLGELKTLPDWVDRAYRLFCDVRGRVVSPVAFVAPPLEEFINTELQTVVADHDNFYLVAVAKNGDWVGFTELRYEQPEDKSTLAQWLTGTHRDWTRRGVASALKAASVLRAKRAGVTDIWTSTAVENAAMIRANERSGYVASGGWSFLERRE